MSVPKNTGARFTSCVEPAGNHRIEIGEETTECERSVSHLASSNESREVPPHE